jgi:hypothetical protein
MNARQSLLGSIIFFTAALLITASASALSYTMPASGGTVLIGRYDLNNGTFQHRAYYKNSVGNCTYLGAVGTSAGLNQNITINGSSGVDSIMSADGPVQFCGFNVQPTVLGIYTVVFNGNGGADSLAGRASTINGGSGDDFIFSSNTVTWDAHGGSNNDWIYISNGGAVYGDDGNDKMCTTSTNYSAWFYGGTGDDLYCGGVLNPFGIADSATAANPFNCPQLCIRP